MKNNASLLTSNTVTGISLTAGNSPSGINKLPS